MKLIDIVGGDKKANFIYYRDNCLWYRAENGFIFPVPIEDIGTATFNAEEKARALMRYIRKYLAEIEQNQN